MPPAHNLPTMRNSLALFATPIAPIMTNQDPVEILLIDDDTMFAEGVRHFFETADIKTNIVANAKEMQKIVKSRKFSLAFLDWNLRDGSHPLESIAILRKAKCKVVVTSDSANGQQQRACLQGGAHGYVEKGNPRLRLLQSVQMVLKNQLDFQDNYADSQDAATTLSLPELKEYEEQMLIQYICNPLLSYKQIAHAINASEAWVKECMPAICRKFGVPNKDQLYPALQRYGIIPVMTPTMAALALKRPAMLEARFPA